MSSPRSDERLGLPSGSSALFDQLCSGRFQLQAQWDAVCPEPQPEEGDGLPFSPEDIDSDKEAGKRIHLLYAGKDCPEASQAEIERAEKARQVDAKMKEEWLNRLEADFQPVQPIIEIREERWWLRDEKGNPVYSGQTDAVWIRGVEGGPADVLIGDLKGLWGKHDDSPINLQLRRYIALIAENAKAMGYTEINSASAYLNQPAKTLSPVLTPYDADAIAMAVLEMHSDIASITDPNAPRTAGPIQCSRCRAKLICAEYETAQSAVMVTVADLQEQPPSKESIEAGVKALPPGALGKLLEWIPALQDACYLAKIEGKRRLRADPESIPGWRLKPNTARAKVDDVTTLYSRLAAVYGITGPQFSAFCSISKENVEQIVRDHSKLKGQALSAKVTEFMAGTTKAIPVSASLEKTK